MNITPETTAADVKAQFSPKKNQSNAAQVGIMTTVASVLAGLIHSYSDTHGLDGMPSKEVLIGLVGFGIGYAGEALRDFWRFYMYPLVRVWYKNKGVSLPQDPPAATPPQ